MIMKYFFALVIAVLLIGIEAQNKLSSSIDQADKFQAKRDKVTKNNL